MRIKFTVDSRGEVRDVEFGFFEDDDELCDQMYSDGMIYEKMLELDQDTMTWEDISDQFDHGTWMGSAGQKMPDRERSKG